MSSSFKLPKYLDFKNLFNDRCATNKNNIALRGPGIFCGIYLVLVVIGLISSTLLNLYSLYKYKTIPKIQLLIYTIIILLWNIFVISFMYSACYQCSGLIGFIIVIFMSLVAHFIVMKLFKSVIIGQYTSMVNDILKK